MSDTNSKNKGTGLNEDDYARLESLGISHQEADRQINLLRRPAYFAELERPCTLGDGIHFLDDDLSDELINLHEKAQAEGRFTKFVPASGAATRMFRELISIAEKSPPLSRRELDELAKTGDSDAKAVIYLFAHLNHLPFFSELQKLFNDDLNKLKHTDDYLLILKKILEREGLSYAEMPKGLLPFHKYPEGLRTSFEEHLVEAAQTIKDKSGICRLHFTVSPEHIGNFETLLASVRGQFEDKYQVRFDVTFSTQKQSTDMLAIDDAGEPFRDENGKVILRPGGHGALIENLNDLKADLVFIKNIDNVQPDDKKGVTLEYKRLLSGFLIRLQDKTFELLRALNDGAANAAAIDNTLAFLEKELELEIPPVIWSEIGSVKEKCEFLFSKLNRPIRVCGMVRNTGEPGGGPFWVREDDSFLSQQIIEGAQVNKENPQQAQILASSTHFNPVDIVCGLRDFRGKPFELTKFVRESAIIKTRKSHKGRALIACERPGLWNGAMADWITIFVNVHESTFTPVKTVLDFLRK